MSALTGKNSDFLFKEETIDGKAYLISPSAFYKHGLLILRIASTFERHLKGKQCMAFTDTIDIVLDQDNMVIPDITVICDKSRFSNRGYEGIPTLVVEVLSPSSINKDRHIKMKTYERFGIKEFWLADYNNKSIEIYVLENHEYVCKNIVTLLPEHELDRLTDSIRVEYKTKFTSYVFVDIEFDMLELFEGI